MKVFVSYARADVAPARILMDGLRSLGVEILADTMISAGEPWWHEVLAQIRTCDAFVATISPMALASQVCRAEREYAVALGRPVLPVVLRRVPPQSLPDDLARIRHFDFTRQDAAEAFALAGTLTALPQAHALPDPLPGSPQFLPDPAIPLLHLTELVERGRAPRLTREDQLALVAELRDAFEDDARRADAIELARELADRTDLFADTWRELQGIVGAESRLVSTSDVKGAPHRPPSLQEQIVDLSVRLREARRLPPAAAAPVLRDIEAQTPEGADEQLLLDLMFAYRDAALWDDVVRLVADFPHSLQERPVAVQQQALALNRRGEPGDAARAAAALEALLDRIGPDSETWGLLGRIYKDRFQRSGNPADLEAAIDAYRSGLDADPNDIYPGINLVTLLSVAGRSAEAATILPQLRATLAEQMNARETTYWDHATALELAVLAHDWDDADELAGIARSYADERWMLSSTQSNLQLLADATKDESDRGAIERIIGELSGVTTP